MLLSEPWILKTLAFVILVGSIMALIESSGGIGGFIEYVENKNIFNILNNLGVDYSQGYYFGKPKALIDVI